MKKMIMGVLLVCLTAMIAFAAAGPDKVDLSKWVDGKPSKKAVEFPHAFHQEKNECTECHMNADGGPLKSIKTGKEISFDGAIKPRKMSNDAHKEFCWECHQEKKVPGGKSCSKCH
ncbi:cytochrome c3 family protein [Limisalsivibrio acetivorans]|uniref:cytochrome c3 family protein n=1 Tax=Limisalsivibrio acetivorans TaxID=1304888 RepID=UPI0003B43D3E|nr:cytochrome c3 family protein [Limisalsivibrio acetivorans]